MSQVAILGLGSVLMGDDAAGPYVLKLLEAGYELPAGVTLLDAGTPGPGLVDLLRGYRHLVVVDTVKAEGPPGTVRLYRRDALTEAPPNLRLCPHDPDLRQALFEADLAGDGPQGVLLVGIVPASVELRTGLSPAVQEALPRVEAEVTGELRRLGLAVRRRPSPSPSPPGIWWER